MTLITKNEKDAGFGNAMSLPVPFQSEVNGAFQTEMNGAIGVGQPLPPDPGGIPGGGRVHPVNPILPRP